jgi:hypothetical protein
MKFLFNRMLPAAIINATLIFLCVIVPWYPVTIIMFAYAVFEPANSSSWFFQFWKFFSPAVAPLIYRVIWQVLKFERSPGEQWLLLNWPVEQQSKLRVVLNEIATGFVATLIAFSAVNPCQIFVGRFFGQSSNGLTIIAGWTLVPLLYCCALVLILVVRYRKQPILPSAGESNCSSDRLKNTARLRETIAIFSMPFLCGIAGYWLTPGYYSALLYQSAAWLIFVIVTIWWAAGAVIFRYWDSRNSYFFYLFFFAFVGLGYLNTLPAISTIFRIGPLNQIY